MFQRAFSALPTDVAAQAINIVDKAPEDNSYDTLKRTVISCLFGSQKKTCSQNYEQEDRTPSVTCDPLWAKSGQMKCLPVNMATCLANNVNRSNLDELPEAESKIQELSGRPCVHAIVRCPYQTTGEIGTDVWDDARKRQPGCKYPKTSQGNFTGSNVSVIPRSAEKCIVQPIGSALQSTSNHFSISLCYLDPHNQDLNIAESLDLNLFWDNVRTHNTRAQSSSKDTVQPSTPSVESSLQDTVKSTTPTSYVSRPELPRTP
ncbi:unnamed protein product [Hymenolepis diminuta]|uniref:Uncharacterized protein n=1 Tax=Hymenolepis diminuta TaxID=6216 RepID=A0A564YK19_HYMDI|nr:unnamed protein product [Hymenolepis diminuta]